MKLTIRVLAVVLTLCMVVGMFVGCKKKNKGTEITASNRVVVDLGAAGGETSELEVNLVPVELNDEDYADYADWAEYKAALGEYLSYLNAAKALTDPSARYAAFAVAEAKLLESAVMLPTTTQGGGYSISRVAYGTANNALWGLDSERYENILVATEFITAEERDEMKAKYIELKGTGTYTSWAKKYLTDKGYTLKDSYTIAYSSDPRTWDILKTYRAADSEAIINTIDGLLSYDNENRLTYALAEKMTVSEDGTVYTFTLRDGLKWVNQNGEEYATLKAQDFVDGMLYMLKKNAGLNGLVFGIIKNAEEYVAGTAEGSDVGVKALDDKTVQYTLCQKTSYFPTMLEYNTFMPLCKAYADAQGADYGKDTEHILYCGPYVVENHTANNKIVFKANSSYWNKDNISIKTISWLYNDGKDVTKSYNDAKAGVIDGAGLNTTTIPLAAKDKLFEKYAYVSGTNATTYSAFVNIKRGSFETEGYGMESTQTAEEKARTAAAVANANFRNAIAKSVDRAAYNGAKVGEATKLNAVRNLYTPGTFVRLTRPIKIKIGTETKTYPIGTYYGQIVQDQLTADGSSLKVWDPKGGDGDGSSDGFDGWYNVEAARAHLTKAIEELGITIDADNPIKLDLPYYSGSATYTAAAQAYKQSVEAALQNKVIVNLVPTDDIYGWYYAGYYCDYGVECNYDLYDCSGWGPDYGDPATYLNTFIANGGDMMHVLGID